MNSGISKRNQINEVQKFENFPNYTFIRHWVQYKPSAYVQIYLHFILQYLNPVYNTGVLLYSLKTSENVF